MEKLRNLMSLFFLSMWCKIVLLMNNRSAKRLLDGLDLVNHRWFAIFTILSPHQTFSLYSITRQSTLLVANNYTLWCEVYFWFCFVPWTIYVFGGPILQHKLLGYHLCCHNWSSWNTYYKYKNKNVDSAIKC